MARAFRFRLAPVLRLRRLGLESRQRQVAERLGRIRRIEAQVARLAALTQAQVGALRRVLAADVVQVEQVLWSRHHVARLRREAADLEATAEQERAALLNDRAALAAAFRAVRVLERLEMLGREAHQADEQRREQAAADELATLRYGRGPAGEPARRIAGVAG